HDTEPRVFGLYRRYVHRPSKREVVAFGCTEVRPCRRRAERKLARFFRRSRRHADELAQRRDPLLESGRHELLSQGPEPKRSPGIHDEAQPAVCAIRVPQALLDLLPSYGAPDPEVTGSPHSDGASNLAIGNRLSLQGELPERLDSARNSN